MLQINLRKIKTELIKRCQMSTLQLRKRGWKKKKKSKQDEVVRKALVEVELEVSKHRKSNG